jgi:hypothetical protein
VYNPVGAVKSISMIDFDSSCDTSSEVLLKSRLEIASSAITTTISSILMIWSDDEMGPCLCLIRHSHPSPLPYLRYLMMLYILSTR